MNVPAKVSLHFERARPFLECEHSLPIKPEVGAPEAFGENFRNLLVFKLLFWRHKQFGQRLGGFLIQFELTVRVGVFASVDGRAAKRVVGIVFVEPIILVEYGYLGVFD